MESFDDVVTDRAVKLKDVQAHLAQMKSNDRFLGRYFVAATSGSTGLRGIFLWDRDEWMQVLASYARANDWAGIAAGLTKRMKLAVVSSRTPWHQSAVVGATLDSSWVPTLRLDATEPIEHIVGELDRFQPDALVGYASMLQLLADEQLAGRLHLAPKGILSASEVLTDDARRRIERAFGQIPFNVYAATEPAGVASDCAKHRMHLYEDLVITEVVDENDHPVPAGVFGAKVLVTVLFSRTLPLIRYEMSDRIALATERCDCGLPFGTIAGVEGRMEDVLTMPASKGGSVTIHPNVFHRVLEGAPVRAWQVIQEATRLRVLVVAPQGTFDERLLTASIVDALAAQGATPPKVDIERVEEIPRTALGKAPLIRRLS